MTPKTNEWWASVLAECVPLPREEETQLVAQAQAGSRVAQDKLVRSHQRYVQRVATHWSARYGAAVEDLVQEANLGLLRGIKGFDPARGVRLLTYASNWINVHVQRFVKNNHSVVRSYSTRVPAKTGSASAARPLDARRAPGAFLPVHDVSLDAPIVGAGDSGDEGSFQLADPRDHAAEHVEDNAACRRRAVVAVALARLHKRDPRMCILVQRRWLVADDADVLSLQEVGALPEFGVSRERVRQLELIALRVLRPLLLELAETDGLPLRDDAPLDDLLAALNDDVPDRHKRRRRGNR